MNHYSKCIAYIFAKLYVEVKCIFQKFFCLIVKHWDLTPQVNSCFTLLRAWPLRMSYLFCFINEHFLWTVLCLPEAVAMTTTFWQLQSFLETLAKAMTWSRTHLAYSSVANTRSEITLPQFMVPFSRVSERLEGLRISILGVHMHLQVVICHKTQMFTAKAIRQWNHNHHYILLRITIQSKSNDSHI